MKYNRCKTERETIINFNECGNTAQIYTASAVMLRNLEKLEQEYPDQVKCIWIEPTKDIVPAARKYEIPTRFIKYRGPRQMSERQRQVLESARQTKANRIQF